MVNITVTRLLDVREGLNGVRLYVGSEDPIDYTVKGPLPSKNVYAVSMGSDSLRNEPFLSEGNVNTGVLMAYETAMKDAEAISRMTGKDIVDETGIGEMVDLFGRNPLLELFDSEGRRDLE